MAIVYVLWGVALLSSMAMSLLSTGNVSYHLSRHGLQIGASRHGRGGRTVARRAGTCGSPARAAVARRRRPPGLRLRGFKMRIAIQDELGRIDLNHADQSLLVGLFRSAGLGAQAASSLVDKILDWRDASPGRRVNGAKDRDYRAAGFAYGPRNGPFQSVDELKLVMDMTPELFERVAPALTVYSGRQFLDPQFAPREALLALPGMTPERRVHRTSLREQIKPAPASIDPAIPLNGRAFSIRTELPSAGRHAGARGRDPADRPPPPTLLAV